MAKALPDFIFNLYILGVMNAQDVKAAMRKIMFFLSEEPLHVIRKKNSFATLSEITLQISCFNTTFLKDAIFASTTDMQSS